MVNTDNTQMEHSVEWYLKRTRFMSEFMLPERFENMLRVVEQRTRYMTILAENTFYPQNASALVRNCEAFGVQNIHTVEMLCKFNPNVHIVRGTDQWVDIYRYRTTAEAVDNLHNNGYRIVATTPHRNGSTPETFDVSKGPFCLVFGTEKDGISDEIIDAADDFLIIPMCGFVESLNVSASAAILLHDLSGKVRSGVDPDVWHLSECERAKLLFEWCMSSVRDSENILLKYSE